MEGERKDIFDGKFGESKVEPEKEELSFSKGAGSITQGIGHIFSGFKHIFFKKFPFNLFFLLVVVGLSVAGTYYLKPDPTGMVVYENITQECPVCEECSETECEVCEECPEPAECEVCENRIVYRYRCPDGTIVEESSECEASMPEITSEHKSETNGVTLAINGIEYKDYEIKRINYTIINEGLEDIKPKLMIKVYETWSSEVRDAAPDKTIGFSSTIGVDDWVIRSDTLNIDFDDDEKRIRIELQDALISPAEEITAVAMDFR